MKKYYNNLAIIFFVLSIIVLSINLGFRMDNNIMTIIGLIFSCLGIVFLNIDMRTSKRRGFEIVSENKRKSKYIHMPERSSEGSAAYDFYCDKDYEVAPNEIIKIWTDIKAYMQKDEVLILNVRSSMSGKFMLANTQGWVDSDYYDNPDNEGNIGIFLKNISSSYQMLKQGDRIAQGMIIKYYTCDNDNVKTKRNGGFGSSGR